MKNSNSLQRSNLRETVACLSFTVSPSGTNSVTKTFVPVTRFDTLLHPQNSLDRMGLFPDASMT